MGGMDLAGVVLGGRYELRRLIGRGGMGEVWHGEDISVLQREVAVKVLPAVSGTTSVRRFDREAAMLARLQHPGITVVHDAGRHDGYLYIVMELLQGQDLARVMADHPDGLPVERVLDFFHQIADALATAHRDGVVHRDLKPANLFVQPGDRIKICDFGIARSPDASDALTTSGVVLGTPLYMSPEQCQGRPVEAPSDIYALGAVLFQLLTGHTPFPADQSPYALIRQHVEDSPPLLGAIRPDIPQELAELVAQMLAKDPNDRPDATALARALADLTADSTTRSEESGEREPRQTARLTLPLSADGGDDEAPRQNSGLLPARWTRTRTFLIGTPVLSAIVLVLGIAVLRNDSDPKPPDWSVRTDGALEVAFSPDGSMLAAGGGSAPILRWDPETGERIGGPLRQVGNVYNVAFSPDGTLLAASTLQYNGTVRLWNPKTGELISECYDAEVVAVAFHPKSTMLATVNQATEKVTLWDPKTGDQIRVISEGDTTEEGDDVSSLAFSPDGTTLATGDDEGAVRLWNPNTGEQIGEPLQHDDDITDVEFSRDGTTLATASADGTVRLWDSKTKGEIGDPVTAHSNSVSDLAFSPDGDMLATASVDDTVRLWNPKTGKQIGEPLQHDGDVTHVAYSPDGTTLTTASDGDTVALWQLPRKPTA
ncbi:hypothetical protein SLUN_38080 [Streptomyces lunaelactis]|uniref:non-specific serine/threonine protein kinase n=1 Tax=Streptomyces lunaelactis TaxID=1535768 RepID=A0A2R4TD93_9ACTN|nr:serine/threonine-protein kinase [Streptomyces lunaelactis]AVZ77100.1 hypothetical protein SLUN_38080 [Streptomyces lunaelactis]NUK03229.1 protein kinase [Streptomyces lunaelactis]NUK18213.1 protein kinase [Streptomyces lunaelactis]NUK85926.1 protein kinase [Streptomyces lunaelactis]